MAYGLVELVPLMFQDDFENTCGITLCARVANIKVDVMAMEKTLTLNQDKTVSLVMGSDKQKEEVRRELELKPLMCGDFETRLVESDKWLVDWLHSGGLGEPCHETIRQREGRVRGAAMEIAAIVDDWRAGASSRAFYCGKPAASPPSSTTAAPGWRIRRRLSSGWRPSSCGSCSSS